MPAGEPVSPPDQLSASLEHYLKAIHEISREKGAARAKDIAQRLDVSGASVTGALRSLAQKGFVNYAPYDIVTLTEEGEQLACDVIRRSKALFSFLTEVLSVDEEEAYANACRMEHVISAEVMDRLVRFVHFLDACPRTGVQWMQGQGFYCKHGTFAQACEHCIETGAAICDPPKKTEDPTPNS